MNLLLLTILTYVIKPLVEALCYPIAVINEFDILVSALCNLKPLWYIYIVRLHHSDTHAQTPIPRNQAHVMQAHAWYIEGLSAQNILLYYFLIQ